MSSSAAILKNNIDLFLDLNSLTVNIFNVEKSAEDTSKEILN